MRRTAIYSAILCLAFQFFSFGEETELNELESGFIDMMENATLTGSWTPVEDGKLGETLTDSYQVVRAVKLADEKWQIVAKMKMQGFEMDIPVPVTLQWAGDVAVIIVDGFPAGPGRAYSARVMFHDDRYAGSWWGSNEPGGLLSGAITR